MIQKLFKSKRFFLGLLFFTILLTASFVYSNYFKSHISAPESLRTTNQGEIISAPFSPEIVPPLGTDRKGNNLLLSMLDGAKYTIIFVFILAISQVTLSLFFGIIYGLYTTKAGYLVKKGIQIFNYIPTFIFVYFLFVPLMGQEPSNIIIKQFCILLIVTVPVLTIYIGEEIKLYMKKDFVTGAKVLGATRFNILKRHIWPYLQEQLVVIYLQQCVEIFLLLSYLGFFKIFIGGQKMEFDFTNGQTKFLSLSNEWAGLIGLSRNEVFLAPWIIIAPLIMVFISIFVLNIMGQGVKRVISINNNGEDRR